MSWKKVAESKEVIVFEKELKDSKLRIEARKNHSSGWEVFKTEIRNDSAQLISEYALDDMDKVKQIIEKLKNGKEPKMYAKRSYSPATVYIKRKYKEDFIEKWTFTVGRNDVQNFLYVKFDNDILVDIVMHDSIKSFERKVLSQIEEKLGLKDLGESIKYDIFYFSTNKSKMVESNESVYEYNTNYIDIEFDYSNNDEE